MLIVGNGKNPCVFIIESTTFFFVDFGRGDIAQDISGRVDTKIIILLSHWTFCDSSCMVSIVKIH